jgi:hypothetical protein
MLIVARIEVERGGVRDVTSGVIGYNRDVIADLVLLRPALSGIE